MSNENNFDGGGPIFEVVIQLQKSVKYLTSQAEINKSKMLDYLNDLRIKISPGERSDNPIRDFIVVNHEIPSLEIESKYGSLQEMLRAHKGEYILAIDKFPKIQMGAAFYFHGDVSPYFRIRIGIITGDELGIEVVSKNSNDQKEMCIL